MSEIRFDGDVHFAGIVRDISDRKQAESRQRQRLTELAHAARLSEMGEMTSGIAHELNQPLTAMVTFATALGTMHKSGNLNSDTLRDSLEQIAAQGLRTGAIVGRLRDLSRKATQSYDDVDINSLVHDVIGLLNHELRLNSVHTALNLEATVPAIHADRIQVEQVVLNLIRNAVDAMSDAGVEAPHLTVTTTTSRGRVSLSVEDCGGDISATDLPHVFDSFFTTKTKGSGLGLSISRSIISTRGGTLNCENRPEGGARFTFELPIEGSE